MNKFTAEITEYYPWGINTAYYWILPTEYKCTDILTVSTIFKSVNIQLRGLHNTRLLEVVLAELTVSEFTLPVNIHRQWIYLPRSYILDPFIRMSALILRCLFVNEFYILYFVSTWLRKSIFICLKNENCTFVYTYSFTVTA